MAITTVEIQLRLKALGIKEGTKEATDMTRQLVKADTAATKLNATAAKLAAIQARTAAISANTAAKAEAFASRTAQIEARTAATALSRQKKLDASMSASAAKSLALAERLESKSIAAALRAEARSTASAARIIARDNASATRTASRIVRNAAAPTERDESRGYAVQRGIVGTGAEGRDFSKQAQGLGGLVHVYATFAANLFAVSAAFTALRAAADTTNMVKGLDQLGASSGRALGSLSKQMTIATDGAITLREAMTATAQASSAGMDDSQILRMTEAAKKASQALGVSMPDAISRITRGITKLEPELLDELGIMVRVDTAAAAYAKTLGKTASTLTDYEKRQGFANAVLDQAEKKFKAIDLAANPFDKLLASMTNLATGAGSIINTVLSPILGFLNSSPIALAAAMALVAKTLLTQAIPALGAFRANAKLAAEEAGKIATIKNIDAVAARSKVLTDASKKAIDIVKNENAQKVAIAFKAASAADTAAQVSADKLVAISERMSSKIRKILALPADEVTPRQLGILKGQATKATDPAIKADFNEAIKGIERTKLLQDEAHKARQIQTAEVAASIKSNSEAVEKAELKKQGFFSSGARLQRDADKANHAAILRRISSEVAENTQTKGFLAATIQGWKDIAEARKPKAAITNVSDFGPVRPEEATRGIGIISAGYSGLKNTISSASASVMGIASSLSNVFMVVGIASAAFAILNGWLTKNAAESKAFSGSLELVDGAAKTLAETMDLISNKDPLDSISAESINAAATAMNGLSSSIVKMTNDFKKLTIATEGSWWNTQIDEFFDDIGKGQIDKFAKSMSTGVTAAIEGMPMGKARDEFRKQTISIFGSTNSKDIEKNIEKSIEGSTRAQVKIRAIILGEVMGKALAEAAKTQAASAASLTEGLAGFDKLKSSFQSLQVSLKDTSPLNTYASSLVSGANLMSIALADPVNSMAALQGIIGDVGRLSMLPLDTQVRLVAASDEINRLAKNRQNLDEASKNADLDEMERVERLKFLEEELAAAKLATANAARTGDSSKEQKVQDDLQEKQRVLTLDATSLARENAKQNAVVLSLQNGFKDIMEVSWKKGIDIMSQGLEWAFAKGALAIRAVSASRIEGAAGIEARSDLKIEELNLQKLEITAMGDLVRAVTRDTLSRDRIEQLSRKNALDDKTASGTPLTKAEGELWVKLALSIKDLDKKISYINGPRGDKGALVSQRAEDKRLGTNTAAGMSEIFEKELDVAKKLAAVNSAIIAEKKNAAYDQIDNAEKIRKTEQDRQIKDLDATTKRAAIVLSYSGIESSTAVISLDDAEDKLRFAKQELEVSTAKFQLERQTAFIKASKKISQESKDSTIAEATKVVGGIEEAHAIENANVARDRSLKLIDTKFKLEVKAAAISKEIEDIRRKGEDAQLEANKADIEYQGRLGILEYEALVRAKAAGELKSIEILNARELASVEMSRVADKEANEKSRDSLEISLEATGLSPADAMEQANDTGSSYAIILKEINAKYDRQKLSLTEINALKLAGLAIATEEEARIARQAEGMAKMVELTSTLTTVFGELGSAVGGVASAIQTMVSDMENFAVAKAKAKDDFDWGNYDERVEAQKKMDAIDKKSAKSQLNNISNIASAGKKLFKEKSAAYKLLDGIEKAAAAYKLAMQLKDIAMTIYAEVTKTAAKAAGHTADIAGTTAAEDAKNIAKIPGVIMSFMSSLGPWGIAAAAVAIAAVLGGSGPSISGTEQLSADDRQAQQGTGTVMGDKDAKSKTIENSLAILQENSFEDLDYSNAMLAALTSIDFNIRGLSNAIARQLGVPGSMFDESGLGLGTFMGAPRDLTSMLFGQDSGLGKLQNKVSNWIFGGNVKTSLKDQGIEFRPQTLGQAAQGVNAVSYQDIQSKKSGGLFRKDKITNSTVTGDLDPDVSRWLTQTLDSMRTGLIAATEALGLTGAAGILDAMQIGLQRISLKGLNGEEIGEAIDSVMSATFDDMATYLMDAYDFDLLKFAKIGEGAGETLIRLARNYQLVDFAMLSVGKTFATIGLDSIEAREHLINASGGIEKFVAQVQDYAKNFMSESERTAITQTAVTKEMTRLGYAGVTTRAQFRALIDSIDVSTVSGANLYASLMNVQAGFASVTEETAELITNLSLAIEAVSSNRDKMVDAFIEGIESGDMNAAGESVANMLVGSIEESMLSGVAGQIFDIIQEGIITPMITAMMTGASVSEALSDANIAAVINKAVVTAAAFSAIWNDPVFQTAMASIKTTVGSALSTAGSALDYTPKYSSAALKATEKIKDKADKDAADASKAEISTLKNLIKTLEGVSKSLKDFKKSLLLDALSPLTPQEKYVEAKAQFENILALSQGPATTEDEIKVKTDALAKLEPASRAFLDASRTINASSVAYTSDFAMVQAALDTTIAAIDAEIASAALELVALEGIAGAIGAASGETNANLVAINGTIAANGNLAAKERADAILLEDAAIKARAAVVTATETAASTTITAAAANAASVVAATTAVSANVYAASTAQLAGMQVVGSAAATLANQIAADAAVAAGIANTNATNAAATATTANNASAAAQVALTTALNTANDADMAIILSIGESAAKTSSAVAAAMEEAKLAATEAAVARAAVATAQALAASTAATAATLADTAVAKGLLAVSAAVTAASTAELAAMQKPDSDAARIANAIAASAATASVTATDNANTAAAASAAANTTAAAATDALNTATAAARIADAAVVTAVTAVAVAIATDSATSAATAATIATAVTSMATSANTAAGVSAKTATAAADASERARRASEDAGVKVVTATLALETSNSTTRAAATIALETAVSEAAVLSVNATNASAAATDAASAAITSAIAAMGTTMAAGIAQASADAKAPALTATTPPAYHAGGLAGKGRAIVGELGPEIVDFKTPGRVYSAKETFGMFNGNAANDDMVDEIRQLRKELEALRKEQNIQTGALINSTYDAQARNAGTVSDAVTDSANKQVWNSRVQANVKLA